jgi:hypothetical protein
VDDESRSLEEVDEAVDPAARFFSSPSLVLTLDGICAGKIC